LSILLGIILIIVVLCISLISVFFLAQRFFGATKEEEWQGVKRSVLGILLVFGTMFILPSLINLVFSFFNKVIWGSMTLNEYSKHIGEFSFQPTYNFYAHLFSRLPKR
jgi:ABC-type Fe3+ transport system permease subunit